MPARQRACSGCGGPVVFVQATHGAVPLDPYPLAPGEDGGPGTVRVDVLRHGLALLAAGDPSSTRTKRYARHRCVTARTAVPPPHKRVEQLGLSFDDVEPVGPM